jgi:cell division protein FtsL
MTTILIITTITLLIISLRLNQERYNFECENHKLELSLDDKINTISRLRKEISENHNYINDIYMELSYKKYKCK